MKKIMILACVLICAACSWQKNYQEQDHTVGKPTAKLKVEFNYVTQKGFFGRFISPDYYFGAKLYQPLVDHCLYIGSVNAYSEVSIVAGEPIIVVSLYQESSKDFGGGGGYISNDFRSHKLEPKVGATYRLLYKADDESYDYSFVNTDGTSQEIYDIEFKDVCPKVKKPFMSR